MKLLTKIVLATVVISLVLAVSVNINNTFNAPQTNHVYIKFDLTHLINININSGNSY